MFQGKGVGGFTGPGPVSWRSVVFHETSGAELRRLSGIAVAFELLYADQRTVISRHHR